MRLLLLSSVALAAFLTSCERDDYDVTPRNDAPPAVDGQPMDGTRPRPNDMTPGGDPTVPRDQPGTNAPGTGTVPGAQRPRDSNSMEQELAGRVRQALDADQTMSARVQSLQVVAQNGVVTLRGTVASQSDKDAIGTKVAAVPGVTRVENELTVNR